MKKFIYIFLPFFIFFLTQLVLIRQYKSEKIKVPLLIGKNWQDLPSLISNDLSVKIIRIKQQKEFEHNYILNQYPSPGTFIKHNQSVLLEINENKIESDTSFRQIKNKKIEDIINTCKKDGILYKIVNNDINNNCKNIFSVGKSKNNIFYIYFFPKVKSKILIKNTIGINCDVLRKLNLSVICYSENNLIQENCSGKIIVKQFPFPVILDKKLQKQLFYVWHST